MLSPDSNGPNSSRIIQGNYFETFSQLTLNVTFHHPWVGFLGSELRSGPSSVAFGSVNAN